MSEQSLGIDAEDAIDSDSVIEFLQFRLDGQQYALELGRVDQVVLKPSVTRVPRATAGIYGSSTVEGDVVVAVDTYAVVGWERPFADPEDGYLVVLNQRDTPQPVGLLVESVDGIERHHVETLAPPPSEGTAPLDDQWFRATIERDEEDDIHVFDSYRLLAAINPLES